MRAVAKKSAEKMRMENDKLRREVDPLQEAAIGPDEEDPATASVAGISRRFNGVRSRRCLGSAGDPNHSISGGLGFFFYFFLLS